MSCRFFSLHPSCLSPSQVQDFTSALKQEISADIVRSISEHLQAMGVDMHIAHWAATTSEGSNREERINSALNLVYS